MKYLTFHGLICWYQTTRSLILSYNVLVLSINAHKLLYIHANKFNAKLSIRDNNLYNHKATTDTGNIPSSKLKIFTVLL